MADQKHRTLRDRGVIRNRVDMDDLVGQIVSIKRVTFGESFTYKAPYVELLVDVIDDVESGALSDTDVIAVSFGKAIVRTFEEWLEQGEAGKLLNPPLVVKLAKEGQTHVLLDLDQEERQPRAPDAPPAGELPERDVGDDVTLSGPPDDERGGE